MTQTLDPTKPCTTRDGRKARILCTDADRPAGYTVIALISEHKGPGESTRYFLMDGTVGAASPSHNDLINTPSIPKGLRGLEKYDALFALEDVVGHLENEGLVVVPIEATQEMILAFAHVRERNGASMDAWKDAIAAWGEE